VIPAAPGAAGWPVALADPAAYPSRPDRVEIRETHLSWVFLAGDRAYKLKKPLVLPFVDYGTPARRRRMCREELRLNARLAPGIYLGVRSVVPVGAGVRIAPEDAPGAVDWVVEMRRYDEGATMAALLARGELGSEAVQHVGQAIAAFHRSCPRARPRAYVGRMEARLHRNVAELIEIVDPGAGHDAVAACERFSRAFVRAHRAQLAARARRGRVREGHGDLRAEHVVLERPLQIVDAIEFDPALRRLDVSEDLASLAMDLTARGGERWARALVGAYRAAGGDPGSDTLVAYFAMHRALVRAKVARLRGGQLPPGGAAAGHEHAWARALIAVAQRFAWQARAPLVLVVCGPPASGKSLLSQHLAAAGGLPHVSSDVERKRLAGLRPHQHASAAHYTAASSARTYRELGRRAAAEQARHGVAIVDATFRRRADREAFAATFGDAAPRVVIECRAPDAVLEARARGRQRRPTASDATPAVARRERARWEPLDEVPPDDHFAVRTDRPVPRIAADVAALLDRWLGGRAGG
jgi:uncharacterized protein